MIHQVSRAQSWTKTPIDDNSENVVIVQHTNTSYPARSHIRDGRKQTSGVGDFLTFIVPLFVFFEFNIVGRLFFSEVILLCALLFLLLSKKRLLVAPLARTITVLGLTWLLGQVITDLVRATPFEDYSRGWSKIAFFLTNFTALFLLIYGSRRRLVLFAVGLAVGLLLDYFVSPDAYATTYPWKFGVAVPTTLLIVLVATGAAARGLPFLAVILTGIAGLLNLYLGSRSAGGICLLTAAYLLIQWIAGKSDATLAKSSIGRIVFLFLFAAAAVFGILRLYEYAAEKGALGTEAQQLYETQASGTYGVLLGGRSDIYVSSRAIMDSPLIGHGSWAKDANYAALRFNLEQYGYRFNANILESSLIPTHSHIFGAWVESGILGAVFWCWVLIVTVRVLSKLYSTREPLTALIAFLAFALIWDILFSPFGAERRLYTAYYVVLLLSFLGAPHARSRTPSRQRAI